MGLVVLLNNSNIYVNPKGKLKFTDFSFPLSLINQDGEKNMNNHKNLKTKQNII